MASNNTDLSVATSSKGETTSPKGSTSGQCLCSPTTHQGSFRCRLHRPTSTAWFKRSNSMPAPKNTVASFSPKSVESA